ncbi:MAG: glycosyltransferase family 4 protein [Syntrophobacterales bacterium]
MSENRIRVLYVVENTSFGGGERGFAQLATGLDQQRFQTALAAHPGGVLEEIARRAGIPFFPLDMSRKVNFGTVSKLSRLISDNRIHIVHSMGARADFFARLACRRQLSTAVVCTVAMLVEGFDVGPLRKTVYKITDRYSARYVTRYITVSRALKDRLVREYGIPPDKISIIYNGVELDQYDSNLYAPEEARRSLSIRNNYPVIGTIGRLTYQKGFSYFLEAAKRVYLQKKQVQFVIVGDGNEEARLKQLADSLGISNVCTFAGLRFDIAHLLSAFDVFVLSSILEGLPRIVIEAMAMQRPIVASDIDGVREQLRHNETGLLVPPADPKALAKAILSILDDQQKAEHLGRAARKAAEQMFDLRHTLAKVARIYMNLFDSILWN